MLTVPNTQLSLILEGEDVSPSVTNRPMIELQENIQALVTQLNPLPSTPVDPTLGQTYTDVNGNLLKWNGTFWEPVSGIYVQATQPINGREGLMWWDSVNEQLYIHNGFFYGLYSAGTGGGGTSTSGYLPIVPNVYDITIAGGETSVPFTYTASDKLMVFINNMIADEGHDYTLGVSSITFPTALSSDTSVKVIKYSVGTTNLNLGVSSVTISVTTSGTTFPYTHITGETEIVFLDGSIVSETDYILSGTQIVFNYSVSALSEIKILKMSPTAAALVLTDAEYILQFDTIYV